MESKSFLFVGGSQEGIHPAPAAKLSLTFVDGVYAEPSEDGVLNPPLNATLETYLLERLPDDDCSGEPRHAYVLIDMESKEVEDHLARLHTTCGTR
jgi:hypothetical protein